jgi:hypothetical protein
MKCKSVAHLHVASIPAEVRLAPGPERRILAGMVGRLRARVGLLALFGAGAMASGCGSDEAMGAGGAGGSGATSGTGGAAGASGADASSDADADASEGDAAAEGCVDIHVLQSMLPEPGKWVGTGPLIGTYLDRDHIWRDGAGVHIAWNADHPAGGGGEMIVSSFDAASGAVLGHRLLPNGGQKGFFASNLAPDGTVALGIVNYAPDAGSGVQSLLLIRSDNPSYEKLYPLPPWPDPVTILVGVGWDGEAFAVHGFGDNNVQFVTRVAPDGTVLLPPTAFGISYGYPDEVRYVTDPASGVSFAVSGLLAPKPRLTGHQRDGTPLPDPAKIQYVKVVPQGVAADAGWEGGTTRPTITLAPGGAAVVWSSGTGVVPITTFIQPYDTSLATSADGIGIPGQPLPPPGNPAMYDGNDELTAQSLNGGDWWVAGTNRMSINEFMVDATGKSTRRELVTNSSWATTGFGVSNFESAKYGDELWLGFLDFSSQKEQPYRIIRAKPGCTYQSMYDLLGE